MGAAARTLPARPDLLRPDVRADDARWADVGDWHEVGRFRIRLVARDGRRVDGPAREILERGTRPGGAGTAPEVYRRRRFVVAAAVAALTAVLVLLVGDPGAGAEAPPAPLQHAVVEPGQTLWEVAADNAPGGTDPRDYLAQIRELNGLEGGGVPAWTVVLLPRG